MLDDVRNMVKVSMMLLKPGERERCSSVVGVPGGRPIPDDGEKGGGEQHFILDGAHQPQRELVIHSFSLH